MIVRRGSHQADRLDRRQSERNGPVQRGKTGTRRTCFVRGPVPNSSLRGANLASRADLTKIQGLQGRSSPRQTAAEAKAEFQQSRASIGRAVHGGRPWAKRAARARSEPARAPTCPRPRSTGARLFKADLSRANLSRHQPGEGSTLSQAQAHLAGAYTYLMRVRAANGPISAKLSSSSRSPGLPMPT